MAKKIRKPNSPPGTIHYTGKKTDQSVRVNYLEFNEEHYLEEQFSSDASIQLSNKSITQWYDIRGLHHEELMRKIGEVFNMHPLSVEDSVDVYKRPELLEYDSGVYVSMKALQYDNKTKKVIPKNVAIYFGTGFILTFQEHEDDLFSALRQRIKNKSGRIRSRKSDYLAYAVIDVVVDQYYSVIDQMEEEIESLEISIYSDVENINKTKIFELKKQLIRFRKNIIPLREAISGFYRLESEMIEDRTKPFLRDLYDHIIQIVDSVDTYRDILSGLHDLYLSEVSMKMNQVMKFLTIITSIFVPISFLAGLYGMNFDRIPELKAENGYFILLGVMGLIVVSMILIFRRMKWF
jgi:magnesium transporter